MIVTKDVLSGTALLDAVKVLVSAIDARNNSFGHSLHVASYAVEIAGAAGWQGQDLEQIRLGALLQDIGQIYWSNEIIHQQAGILTEEERKIIESHTYRGVKLIEDWPSLNFVKPYILYHQEWYDGSGYPYGLKGESLPSEVQVVSLADVYEALHHPRIYKNRLGYSTAKAIEIMKEMKGKRWQCELFEVFIEVAKSWQ